MDLVVVGSVVASVAALVGNVGYQVSIGRELRRSRKETSRFPLFAVRDALLQLVGEEKMAEEEAVGAVAALLDATYGPMVLDALPKTSLAEAAKDPDSARGSAIRASGTVIEIRKVTGTLFQGSLASDDGVHVVYFFTSMPTAGVYANSWAAFRGVFVQEYDYANVSGGQTRSLLLVGGFQH